MYCKTIFCLVVYTTLLSDNHLRFQKNHSSGKIDKYDYLTGEEILHSDQSTIIEQAKFTYSPLEKVFEKQIKQIKTIENKGEKQVKAIEQREKQLAESNALIKNYDYYTEKEMFNKLIDGRRDEILKLSEKTNDDDLKYHYKVKI